MVNATLVCCYVKSLAEHGKISVAGEGGRKGKNKKLPVTVHFSLAMLKYPNCSLARNQKEVSDFLH